MQMSKRKPDGALLRAAVRGYQDRLVPRMRKKVRLPIFDSGENTDAILIAGTGRSGTTWLAEMLKYDREFRTIFEPFHPGRSLPELAMLGRPGPGPNSQIELEKVKLALQGDFRCDWTDQFNERLFYKRRLVKSIRINLFIGEIARMFPWLPVIVVIRHPVLNSASRLRGGWPSPLNYFDSDAARSIHPAVSRYVDGRDDLSKWEASVAFWCIETLGAIQGADGSGAKLVSHEELILDVDAVNDVFDYALVDRPSVLDDVRSPSKMTRNGSSVDQSRTDLNGRLEDLLSRESGTIGSAQVLADFGLSKIYDVQAGAPVVPADQWCSTLGFTDEL